jgi:hypothetical protein
MRRHLLLVAPVIASAENAAVDLRMQGLDAAVEDFGRACVLAHRHHRDVGVGKQLRRPAGRKDFDVELAQRFNEIDEAALVADAHQCTCNLRHPNSFSLLQSTRNPLANAGQHFVGDRFLPGRHRGHPGRGAVLPSPQHGLGTELYAADLGLAMPHGHVCRQRGAHRGGINGGESWTSR